MISSKNKYKIDKLIAGPEWEADMTASSEITQFTHNEFKDVFHAFGVLKNIFVTGQRQVQSISDDSKLHSIWITVDFKDELDQLQKLQITVHLDMDWTSEWCCSFVLVPKCNRDVWLCLDPARPNQAHIRPVHRGPIINKIFPS